MIIQITDLQRLALLKKASRLSDKSIKQILDKYDYHGKIDNWYCILCEEAERRKEFYFRQYTLFD